jgi:phage gpG-like protein
MNLSIEVEGESRLLGSLASVAADISDHRPSWRAVSDEIYSIERAQFQTQGTRGSGRWKERAESTVARYSAINRKGFAVLNETLRRTDALFRAVTTRGAPSGVYDEQKDSLTVGTTLPYAVIHQKGGAKIPQRKIYDLTEADARRLLSIVKRGLVSKIADRGFDFKETSEIPF